jgi:hypothetical protein
LKNTGAFLRLDGELEVIVRSTQTRVITDKQWTLYATDREVARLVTAGDRHSGPVNEGWYLMPFEITFTLP